jgi:ACS family tartrate transporter-like MFS transporter
VFWAIPPLFLGGSAAAAGIAMINAIGNLGGFVGPSIMGFLRKGTDSYDAGLLLIAAALTLQAILVLSLRLSRPTPEPVGQALAPVPAK